MPVHDPHAGLPHTAADDEAADSVGIPWGGRTLSGTGFDDDQGQADGALAAAMADRSDEQHLLDTLAHSRLLVPVVAEPVEVQQTEGGLHADKQVDMAAVTLVAPDGRRALPAFTSLESLARWDPQARPVPVTAYRAAQAAVSEGCQTIVVDLADEQPWELRPSMVWALAQETRWLPAHEDPFVAEGVAKAVAEESAVRGHDVSAGPQPGVLAVRLGLAPGLDAEEVQSLVTRVGERIATDGELRARIDGLAFAVRPAD
ncbi:MAG: SseB family protein [Micrococcales bacterium]|nr:SseB family protein [Micrococcales bacterium]